MLTEVQDVNPLYGRDSYAGQFTRPAGAAANNLYNLADFMFGLRWTYALSNILVAELRQNMHFLYLQDDWRVNDRLTLNAGLRYEYATPMGRSDNVLSNFDPATKTMVMAKDGSLEDRSTLKPDRNNFGPRLGIAYTLTPRTVIRGGYGISYVHFHRAGGANVLPINGPQVINAVVVQTNAPSRRSGRTQQGYPAGLDRSGALQSAARQHHLHAEGLPLERRAQLVRVGAARDLGRARCSTSPTSAIAPTACCCSPTTTRRRRTTPPARCRCRRGGRFPDTPTSPTRSTAASRAITRSRPSSTGASRRHDAAELADAVADQGQRRRLARESQRQFPGAAGLQQPRRRLRLSAYHQPYNSTTSFVIDLPFGRGRRYMSDANAAGRGDARRLADRRHQHGRARRDGDADLHAARGVQVSGIQQDFRGANNYRPNVNGDPAGAGRRAHAFNNWLTAPR